jgi:hypothetical protein
MLPPPPPPSLLLLIMVFLSSSIKLMIAAQWMRTDGNSSQNVCDRREFDCFGAARRGAEMSE